MLIGAPSSPHNNPLRIVTWNIGLRGLKNLVFDQHGGSLASVFTLCGNPDILCLQETKTTKPELAKWAEALVRVPDVYGFFSFNRRGTGYSGVVTYCRSSAMPVSAEEGFSGTLGSEHIGPLPLYPNAVDGREPDGAYSFSIARLDTEGRCVITDHRAFVLFNVYFPAGGSGEESRLAFKAQFNVAFELRVRALLASGRDVIVVGDVNIAHRAIDHCDPAMWEKEARQRFDDSPNRRWLSSFLGQTPPSDAVSDASKRYFVDSFRVSHPTREKAFTCWNSVTSARLTNYGTRLDYVLPCDTLASAVMECDIAPDVQGSDHCPVYAVVNIDLGVVPTEPPPLWAGNLPELSGKQAKLRDYFLQSPAVESCEDPVEIPAPTPVDPGGLKRLKPAFNSVQSASSKKQKVALSRATSRIPSLMSYFGSKPPPTPSPDNPTVVVDVEDSDVDEHAVVSENTGDTPVFEDKSHVLASSQVSQSSTEASTSSWKSLFRGPIPPPLCRHNEPCVERTVLKKGPTMGKVFYVCARPNGLSSDPAARCNYFRWHADHKADAAARPSPKPAPE